MRKNYLFFLIATLALASGQALASQTRVSSTGGLGLVITDETAEINPFTMGNPAGLALIDRQNRFDVGGQWFRDVFAGDNSQTHTYGTLAQLWDDSVNYHGLILFPTKEWAIQGDGDYYHTENVPDYSITDGTFDRMRELFRTAYDFGPFTLGSEIQPSQISKTLVPQPVSGGNLTSGQSSGTALISTSGLLINIPGNPGPKQIRFRIGGSFATQVLPYLEKYTAVVQNLSGTANVTQTVTADTEQSFGPDLYLEIPQTFQATLLARFSTYGNSLSRTSNNPGVVPNLPSFHFNSFTDTFVFGTFKLKHSLPSVKLLGPSVNFGGYFLVDSQQSNRYQPNGSLVFTQPLSDVQGGIGGGIEKQDDYMVGLQTSYGSQTGTYQPTSGSNLAIRFSNFHVSLGGEKWFSRLWAFRVGLGYDYEQDSGQTQSNSSLAPPGGKGDNITIYLGGGFKDKFFKTDLLIWVGQSNILDSPLPDQFSSQIAVQLAASILFN